MRQFDCLRGSITAIEREMEYYKQQYEEARAVIAQLHRGYALPGETTYIHPADFAEILNKSLQFVSYVDVKSQSSRIGSDSDVYVVSGVRYKQSALMPKITKNFE